MSHEHPHGGARTRAGRPKGSKNKVPSKSIQSQQEFAELIQPRLVMYFNELDAIATDRTLAPKDRLAAITELLNRAFGRPKQSTELSGPDGGPIELTGIKELLVSRLAALDGPDTASNVPGEPER